MAISYHQTYQFDEAIGLYEKFLDQLKGKKRLRYKEQVDKKVQECKNGLFLIENPSKIQLINLDKAINSKDAEYAPIFSDTENLFFFVSRQLKNNSLFTEIDSIDYQAFEEIMQQTNINDSLTVRNDIRCNSFYHDAVVSLSGNEKWKIIYRSDNGGDLFWTKYENKQWNEPEAFPKPINSKYHESSGYITNQGDSLYFVSNHPKQSIGGHDIFLSIKDSTGEWQKPVNLGDSINTAYNEESVFLHLDRKTLYFSSRGHNTMGGYDIFKSKLNDSQNWTKPSNAGAPINTPANELFFFVSASGAVAFYASDRVEGLGKMDIYTIPLIEKFYHRTMLKGKITDAKTKQAIENAYVEIYDTNNQKIVVTNSLDSGNYHTFIPSGDLFVYTHKTGYLFNSKKITVPKPKKYAFYSKNFALTKLEVDARIILSDIEFDYSQSSLRENSFTALNQIVIFMQQNPSLIVEISGHTDNKGSMKVNQKLSLERAQSVVDYLTNKGIEPSRLKARGAAYNEPIATNNTTKGRQKNRRVEFKILKL